jgi:hypothetical protein
MADVCEAVRMKDPVEATCERILSVKCRLFNSGADSSQLGFEQ